MRVTRSLTFALAAAACGIILLVGCGTGGTATGNAATGSTASSGTGSASGSTGSGTSGTGTTGTGTPAASATTVATAARLLDQATFGPTTDSIAHVQSLGVAAWLQEQFATPQTVLPNLPNPLPTQCANGPAPCFESEFWQTDLSAPDQLRQRVAFSLGELFVSSTQSVDARAMVPYYNTLAADAFTNWRTIMEDVTLSPAMGLYLDMIQAGKPAAGQHANENFAREMMQLFSVGLVKLNHGRHAPARRRRQPPSRNLHGSAGRKPSPTPTRAGPTPTSTGSIAVTKFPNGMANYFYVPHGCRGHLA